MCSWSERFTWAWVTVIHAKWMQDWIRFISIDSIKVLSWYQIRPLYTVEQILMFWNTGVWIYCSSLAIICRLDPEMTDPCAKKILCHSLGMSGNRSPLSMTVFLQAIKFLFISSIKSINSRLSKDIWYLNIEKMSYDTEQIYIKLYVKRSSK